MAPYVLHLSLSAQDSSRDQGLLTGTHEPIAIDGQATPTLPTTADRPRLSGRHRVAQVPQRLVGIHKTAFEQASTIRLE